MTDLLTESEVLQLLRISRTTIWTLRKKGIIPHYKIGGQYRYNRAEVLEALRGDFEKKQPAQSPSFAAIDLFAGIGGIRLGFERAFDQRIIFVYSNDSNSSCCETYKANFGTIDPRDITEVIENISEIPEHDILLAGFPCQPFSIAGEKRGFKDKTRGNLFFSIAEILDKRTPKAFLLENVKHFKHHDGGRTWKTVKDILENDLKVRYRLYDTVLNSKHFGVPQNRPRFFMVGFRDKELAFNWPHGGEPTPKLADILEHNVGRKYHIGQQYLAGLKAHRRRHEAKGHGFGYRVLNPEKDLAGTLVIGGMGKERNLIQNKPLLDCWKEGDDPLKKKNNEGVRKLTPREFARLQGFPEAFEIPVSDTQAYKQFANSVTVPVIEAIAKKMLASLEGKVRIPSLLDYSNESEVRVSK